MIQNKEEFDYIINGLNLDKLRKKSVFLSYGHDDFLPYAQRLSEDLKRFVNKVWFDEQCIRSSHKWDVEIENGISTSDTVIALMTKHAYRRPAGVCLNEAVYASNSGKEIVPVLVERITVPLLLCNIQYVDVCEIYNPETKNFNEERYFDTLKRLLICIENPEDEADGRLSSLKKFLLPMDNHLDITEKTRDFVGREWLAERFNAWLSDEKSSAVFFLMGGPGTGKSSFAANLAMTTDQVKGIHFCKYNDKYSGNLKTVIKTLAYHVASQLSQLFDYLEGIDLEKLVNASDLELFKTLLLYPLQNVDKPKSKIVLIVDGLDEMNSESMNSFLSLLEEYYLSFPDWLKIVLTARSNPSILNRLHMINPYILDTLCAENKEDIRRYLDMKLANVISFTDEQIEKIMQKSEGVFQYVVFLVQEIQRKGWATFNDIDLPQGLSATYHKNFARCFPDTSDYLSILPVLEVMCAAQKPLTVGMFQSILKNSYLLNNTLRLLGDYIVVQNGSVVFFHKSIRDWLTNQSENLEFYVNTYNGHISLAAWVSDNIVLCEYGDYLYEYGFYHMYKADMTECIYEILNEQEDIFYDSFIVLIERLLINGVVPKKLFRGMKRHVNALEYLLCKIISVFYEKSIQEDFIELLINSFFDCYSWLEDYANLIKYLYSSCLTELLEVGEKLLGVVDNQEIRLTIYNYMGDGCRLLGDHELAFSNYLKVINGYPERQLAEKCFASVYNYYDLRYVKGYLQEAEQAIEKFSKKVSEQSFKQYKVWRLKGNINYQAGRLDDAAECFCKSLYIAERNHRRRFVAEAHYSIAEALACIDSKKATEHLKTAREIALSIKSEIAYSRTYFADVEILVAQQKWKEAIEAGEKGVELVTKSGYLSGTARIKQNMAVAYYNIGNYDKAIEHALFAHQRYKARDSYPAARIMAWKTILEAADKSGRLSFAVNIDNLESIPNLHEFNNLDENISIIRKLIEKEKHL